MWLWNINYWISRTDTVLFEALCSIQMNCQLLIELECVLEHADAHITRRDVRQKCTWTGFWIFWIRTPAASISIRSKFFCCSRIWTGFGFCVCWKNITSCLLDLYLCGVKQESNYLCHFGTESGGDSDWKFAKQDWIRTKKIRVRILVMCGSISTHPGLPNQKTKRETSDAWKSQLNQASQNGKSLKFGSENQWDVHKYLWSVFVIFPWSCDLEKGTSLSVLLSVRDCAQHTRSICPLESTEVPDGCNPTVSLLWF